MALWLKCPECQGKNPLYLQACSQCGASLVNLPPKRRVYVVEPGGPATPRPAPPPAATVAAQPVAPSPPPFKAAPKVEKKPKPPKKKKG